MSVAPNAINYGNQLPLGIEAKSQRRLFFPSTGETYSDAGSNIIRLSLNYDGMLDTHLSYLKFDFQNTTVANAGGNGLGNVVRDLGQPEIRRLVVSSGGVVLEDIQNYNHLVGGILAPCQYGQGNINEALANRQCFSQGNYTAPNAGVAAIVAAPGGAPYAYSNTLVADIIPVAAAIVQGADNGLNVLGPNQTTTVTYKLHSGLLDNDKYLPLVLMNNGLDIEIHLAPGTEVMTSDNAGGAAIPTNSYTVSNVRYVAHLIDLQRDFYDMLRQTQQASGGVIQIAGQTYRNFTAPLTPDAGPVNMNIPVRARSIKSVVFKASAAVATTPVFTITGACNLFEQAAGGAFNLQIGATRYPPTAIQANAITNKAEPYFELMKSFGKLGSTIHHNLLNNMNYLGSNDPNAGVAGTLIPFAPFGIDLETFRAEIENGIDTSSRALPMTLQLTKAATAAGVPMTMYMYCLIDTLFFINMDGSVSVSS